MILAGLALIAAAGEAWLRIAAPSFGPASPSHFTPGVGVLWEPHTEVRYTNHLDFRTAQRVNGLGFLDREPPDPARAAASCHVALIGDSFVAGRALFPGRPDSHAGRAEALSRRPGYEWILDGWRPPPDWTGWMILADPPPLFAEALEFTAWSLAEFRRRADRDGAALAILSVHHLGDADSHASVLLRSMADPLGVPVISQHDWIVRAGGRLDDATFRHDVHWSPQGHQWAAEAVLDWLRQHPEVCEDAP